MRSRVLIVPGTTLVAREICNSLSMVKGVSLYGAGYDLASSERFPYRGYEYVDRLSGDHPAVLEQLKIIVRELSIDFIFLAHDDWILGLRHVESIEGATLVKHNSSAIDTLSYKSSTYDSLREILPTPLVFHSTSDIYNYPVFLKPNRGQGSRGARKVSSMEEAFPFTKNGSTFDPKWIITEYLVGLEVTVDCFSDKHSSVIYSQPRLREKIDSGISVVTRTLEDISLSQWAQKISSVFKLTGCWFYQVKQDANNEWVLLEVGLRIAGASGVNRLRGVNLSLMWIYEQADAEVQVLEQTVYPSVNEAGFHLDFEYESIYVDFDDTLVSKEKPNTHLIKFLGEARDSGKRVQILTRNSGLVDEVLEQLGVGWLCGTILYARDDTKKSSLISESSNLLFIDDSFRERAEVKSAFGSRVLVLDESAFTHGVSTNA